MRDRFLSKEYNFGKFRFLPKLHKNKFSIRPIINYQNHITSKLCHLIDFILQPYIKKFPSYIKDSQNLIQISKDLNFSTDSQLFSCDFENLYTNINLDTALSIFNEFLVEVNFYSKHITIKGLVTILKFIFDLNIFSYKDKFYKQIKGIAMGSKCGPSIANLYVYFFERKFLSIHKPLFYKRFIDDIILILNKDFDINIFINSFDIKLNISSFTFINFLDLNIQIDKITGRLIFYLYIKPTNSFSYLLTDSNHPSYIFKNIPKGLFIRIRRICTYLSDYLYYSSKLIFQLVSRGYNYKILRKICFTFGNLKRDYILPYRNKELNQKIFDKSLFFKVPFLSNYKNIKDIILDSFYSLKSKSNYFTDYNIKPIFFLDKSISNILVFNNRIKSYSIFYCKKCNVKNCMLCNFLIESYYIKLDYFYLPIFSNSNCSSINCIYVIKCKLCYSYYIGQTKNVKNRIRQHNLDIINFKPYFKYTCVSLHFNTLKHDYKKHFSFYILFSDIEDLDERLKKETFIINLFKNLGFNLINDYIPSIYNVIS